MTLHENTRPSPLDYTPSASRDLRAIARGLMHSGQPNRANVLVGIANTIDRADKVNQRVEYLLQYGPDWESLYDAAEDVLNILHDGGLLT